MKCTSCGAAVPEGGQFCPSCGANQGFPAAPPSSPQEPEAPIWSGRYSPMADGGSWILWVIYAGASTFAGLKWLTFPEPWMWWIFAGVVLFPAVVIATRTFIRRISVSYRLTTHRIFKEIGIVSRKITEIELLRIDDLSVTQNVIQRIFDIGVVTLLTSDSSDPKLEISGISHPVEVKEMIRTYVQKRRGRTVNLESL
jgi:uncharacterized membrane protein YdbT with pleckstrin-like domain